jgi:hypothetical protein
VLSAAVLFYFLAEKPHQDELFAEGMVANRLVYLWEILLSNLVAFRRVFLDGWLKTFGALSEWQWQYVLVALAITLVAGATVILLFRVAPEDDSRENMRRHLPALILAGLALVGLSFFPYSITGFRYEDSRVFYYAAAGGALITGVVCEYLAGRLARWRRPANILLWGIVMFLISFNGLSQHAGLVRISLMQQRVLVSVVEQAPRLAPRTTLVLLSDVPVFTYLSFVWQSAVNWTYEQTNLRGIVCVVPHSCTIPYASAVVFEYSGDQGARLLDTLPAELQGQSGSEGYAPYKRISYPSFPERPKVAFDVAPDPAHLEPQGWAGKGRTLNDRRVCDAAYSGHCSLQFSNDGGPTTFSQQVDLSGTSGSFVFSLCAQAKPGPKGDLAIASVTIRYVDGATDTFDLSGQLFRTWTRHTMEFKVYRPYSSLLVELHPNTTTALIWLDGLRLTRDGSVIPILNGSFEK